MTNNDTRENDVDDIYSSIKSRPADSVTIGTLDRK